MAFQGKIGLSTKLLRENPETAKAGKKWLPEEDEELIQQATSKMDLAEIATAHQRTERGVKLRIMMHAIAHMNAQNKTIEDAADHFNITVDDLTEYQRRSEQKKQQKQDEQQASSSQPKESRPKDKYMDILTEIRDLLKVIAEK